MKKIIVAIDNKKILNKIKKINNEKLILKNVEYREAILEILKKEKNIDFIFINEKLSGEISIEDLINQIKKIKKEINIIFFLEKEDVKKENKLKKLGIKNIYIINKINLNEILNLLEENKLKDIEKMNKNLNYEVNHINKKYNKNKIVAIYGEPKSGKTTITNLLIINLIEKNKKILLINLNNKIENNYLVLLRKNFFKNTDKKNNDNIFNYKNNLKKYIKKSEIKINENITFLYKFSKIFDKRIISNNKKIKENLKYFFEICNQNYDYILVDIGITKYGYLEKEIINNSNKKVIVWNKNPLAIKDIRELMKKNRNNKLKKEKSLYIVQNKYYFNSISNSIIRNILGKSSNVYKILYNENYKNLNQKILKKEKIKIRKSIKKQIEKILK